MRRRGLLVMGPTAKLALSPDSLPGGDAAHAYNQTVVGHGGLAPYTFTVTAGALPTGLTLDPLTGAITGTPQLEGTYTFTITVTDSWLATGHTDYSIAIVTNIHDYMAYLGASHWLWLPEASGVVAPNRGSLGHSFDGAITIGAGSLDPVDGVHYDGADTMISIPAGTYQNAPSCTYAVLIKPSGPGELTAGYVIGTSQGNSFIKFNGSLAAVLNWRSGQSTAMTGSSSGLTTDQWVWLFGTLDWNGDKTARLYQGKAGAVTELPYSSQVAGAGFITDYSDKLLVLGNNGNASATFAGIYKAAAQIPVILTPTQMLEIVKITGL